MVYAVKINITKLNRDGIFYTVYRTPQDNTDNKDVIDDSLVEEVAVIDQDAYDSNNYEKESGRYVFYDIDDVIRGDWQIDNDPRLCPNAIEYKSYLTTNTDIPTPNYSYEYRNGLLYFQAEEGSTVLGKDYSYFVKAFRLGRYIADSTKRGFLNISVPSGITASDIKTEIYVDDDGTDVLLNTDSNYNFNSLLAPTPVENYIDPFDNITNEDIYGTGDKDIRMEVDIEDHPVIILPNIFSNSTMINKYKKQYEAATYKIVNKNRINDTVYNTTSLNVDSYSINNPIKDVIIDCVCNSPDPDYSFTYKLTLHNCNDEDVSVYQDSNNIFEMTIDYGDGSIIYNSDTKHLERNIYYDNTNNENEYIVISLPTSSIPEDLEMLHITLNDYSNNPLHEYTYNSSVFDDVTNPNPYINRTDIANGYTQIDNSTFERVSLIDPEPTPEKPTTEEPTIEDPTTEEPATEEPTENS